MLGGAPLCLVWSLSGMLCNANADQPCRNSPTLAPPWLGADIWTWQESKRERIMNNDISFKNNSVQIDSFPMIQGGVTFFVYIWALAQINFYHEVTVRFYI